MRGFIEYTRIDEADKLGSLTIFDIDDTLFHTTAEVIVKKDGKVSKRLSNQEYNRYTLRNGEEFDFSEFRSAKKFFEESRPIRKMMAKASAIIKNSTKNPLSKVIAVTARADFDDKEKFLSTFRKHGIDIDKVRVERAGNMPGGYDVVVKKVIIIRSYLKTGKYTTARLFDDALMNVRGFLDLQDEFPDVKFEGYFVNQDGTIKTIKQ